MKKKNKGITLIALVITIIVLLILAGVAIAMLSGENGILKKAAEAKTKTDEAQENETKDLQALEYLLKKNTGERCWQYKKDSNGRKTIVTDGTVELSIGTYINYDPTKDEKGNEFEKTITSNAGSPTDTGYYKASEKELAEGNGASNQTFSNTATTNGWRLLGVDEETGELLIIPTDSIKTTNDKLFTLRGIAGYIYGESELNKVCSIFGYGKWATGARSINLDDVNKITGYNPNNVGKYDPEQKENGTKYGEGEVYEYGNNVTFSWTETANVVSWSGSNGKSGTASELNKYADHGFNWYDIASGKWKNSMQDITKPTVITTLINRGYNYYADSLTTTAGEGEGLDTTSKEYEMLFKLKDGGDCKYWLASRFEYAADENCGIFGIYRVWNQSEIRTNSGAYLYTTYGNESNTKGAAYYATHSTGVRPVVSLKSDVTLEKGTNEIYNILIQ